MEKTLFEQQNYPHNFIYIYTQKIIDRRWKSYKSPSPPPKIQRKEKKRKIKERNQEGPRRSTREKEGDKKNQERERKRERGIKEGRLREGGGGGDASFPCRITIAMAANQIE